jgi:hypothetical protein
MIPIQRDILNDTPTLDAPVNPPPWDGIRRIVHLLEQLLTLAMPRATGIAATRGSAAVLLRVERSVT